jgi:DNA-directed RNA polymerase specialized sigma24 family protein
MSEYVQWITAEAENPAKAVVSTALKPGSKRRVEGESSPQGERWENPPTHAVPGETEGNDQRGLESALDRNPDIWLYRKRTTGLLRRYMRLSLEAGRLPSVIGREFFRAKVTTYTSVTFEDRVIFVHDVEVCLERLEVFDQGIVARVVLQEQDHERAARLLGCTRKTIERRLPDLIDEISEEFLRVGLLVALSKKEGGELANPFLA